MREVLRPIASHNPDVDAQRPGYCIVDPATDLFACAPADTTTGITMNRTCSVGWCKASGPVTVWASLGAASSVAQSLKAKVVTVPRSNGYCVEWQTVAMVMGDPQFVEPAPVSPDVLAWVGRVRSECMAFYLGLSFDWAEP